MYAKLLRFDVGFGRPRSAEQIATETQKVMSRWTGFDSMELLADYLGGRYTMIAYWHDDRQYYDFSHSADARELEGVVGKLMSGVPYTGFYQVYLPE